MTRIYLIRHAEAEGNCYRRAQGHTNSLLTPNGLAQLEKLSGRFSMLPLDAVYASDLYRAYRTAQAVAKLGGHTVRIDPSLREIYLGGWEDNPWGQIRHDDPMRLSLFTEGKPLRIPGGESTEEALERMLSAVTRIAEANPGATIAVVSHGHVIKNILERIAGRPIAHLDNASASLVEYMCGSFRILSVGQNDYLGTHSTLARQSWWRESGSHEIEFRFSPALFPEDKDRVCDLGKTAWESVYGTEDGFHGFHFIRTCEESSSHHQRYVQFVLEKEKIVGLMHLRNAPKSSGSDLHISLLYLEPPLRGRGLGAQMLGEAVSLGRLAGKEGITLRVWHKNARGLAFYRKMGFVETGCEEGLFGTLLLMRLPITVPCIPAADSPCPLL